MKSLAYLFNLTWPIVLFFAILAALFVFYVLAYIQDGRNR